VVQFERGAFKKVAGIVKFLLRSVEPEFGLYVSPINFDPRDPVFPLSYPAGYAGELARETGLFHTQGMPLDTWAVNEGRLDEDEFLAHVADVFGERRAILDYELGRLGEGLLFCYFDTADIVQHMFWRHRDPRHPRFDSESAEKYRDTIERWYERLDGLVGAVAGHLGPEDLLLILSDHGCGTFRRAAHVNGWLRRNGYLELRSPERGEGGELLADVDWRRTRAYAIGFGAIYINRMGREGAGVVRPGEETARLKEEIAAALLRWRDEKYGSAVVRSVYRGEEIFSGPYAAEMPDLFIGFNAGYRASRETAVGAVPATAIEDNGKKWSGSHLFDPALVPGVLFCSRPLRAEDPGIIDIAPTILEAAGFSAKDLARLDMDGRSLF
jgi:predicted AlkP superfamily phosphohydrolase/phosphomutase